MTKLPAAFRYRAFGLLVASELEIPGAQLFDAAGAHSDPELNIVLGRASLHGPLRQWGPYTLHANGLVFEQPGVARYAFSPQGALLTIEPLLDVSASVVGEYLIATALPAALWMRGDLVLHAATATLAGRAGAIAFAGASGSGKSSVLRSLLEHEACVVAEDSVCLRNRDSSGGNAGIEASGLPGSILLRRPNAALDANREAFCVPVARQVISASLDAVVVLGDSASTEGLRRLSSTAALEALLHHRHRATVPYLLGLDAVELPRFAALARRLPVYLWNRPLPGLRLTENEVRVLRELPGAIL